MLNQKSQTKVNFFFILLILILFFSRIFRLDFPQTYYFDEVYHAFTAQAYARNDPRGYEWWNQAPEGFAYEWLHPPLAKLIQASSIRILGDTPFAWRFPGTLFATATVFLLFLFGKNVLGSSLAGFIAAFLYTFDGLSLTMSRITMNDIYFTFWIVLAFYLFLRNIRLPVVGFILGLAIATKWTAAFGIVFLGLVWLVARLKAKKITLDSLFLALLSFLLIPLVVYLLSYTQFFLQGHSWGQFRELHNQIWLYQTGLEATHPFQSSALSWIVLQRPVWAYVGYGEGVVANIYLMGNPLIWWVGLIAVVALFAYLVQMRLREGHLKGKDFSLLIILLGYFGLFLPWTISPRIMFIYHYLPALPFMMLALGWALSNVWKRKKWRFWAAGYLLFVVLVFIFFYPHWTGIFVPRWLDNLYYWLPGWR